MLDQIKKQYRQILENPLSRQAVDLIIANVGNDKEKFSVLINFILMNKEPLSSHAAWVIEGIDKNFPTLVYPYIPKLIKNLPTFNHPGIQRNVLKILTRKKIPEHLQGYLTGLCFTLLQKK